jgi:3-methyladenine DNA glycosylase AlkD
MAVRHDESSTLLLAEISGRLQSDEFASWRTPDLDRLFRGYRQRLRALPLDARLALALDLYRAGRTTDAHIANRLLAMSADELDPRHAGELDRVAGSLTAWGNVDPFCTDVMQPYLRQHPDAALALVRDWNTAALVWKRRASVVTFTRKVGGSGQYTDEVLRLCDRLLDDPEDLVRKGVGWALKDNLRGNKPVVLEYVKALRRRGVSSVITLYAIRDLRGAERAEVLAIAPLRTGTSSASLDEEARIAAAHDRDRRCRAQPVRKLDEIVPERGG